MAEPTVIVADDDAGIRTVISRALSREGYRVQATGTAATLWRWIEDGTGEVVILDVVLPDENTLDLLPRLKQRRPSLPVIMMSAQNTLLTAVRATERGAFDYLPKPFDLAQLVTMVKRALALPRNSAVVPEELTRLEEQLPIIGRSPAMQEILWYNPISHIIGEMRAGFYGAYRADYVSYLYVFGLGLTLFAVGAYLLRRHASFLIEQ